MLDLTRGLLPSATFVGGHLKGLEQSSMSFSVLLNPEEILTLFLSLLPLLPAKMSDLTRGLLRLTTGEVTNGDSVTGGADVVTGFALGCSSISSISSTNVGISSSAAGRNGALVGVTGLLLKKLFFFLFLTKMSDFTLGLLLGGLLGNDWKLLTLCGTLEIGGCVIGGGVGSNVLAKKS